jgi:hypothetical protein
VLLAQVLPSVADHRPEHTADWLCLCARAIGYAHPDPFAAAAVSGALLAVAVHLVEPDPPALPALLEAVRAGLSAAAPDPDLVPDPLASFARLTLEVAEPEPDTDPARLPALFDALDDDDRALLSELLLDR